jgi:glutaredoxin
MIVIYGKNNCVWCDKAKEVANNFQLKYEYKNVDDNHEFALEVYEKLPDLQTFPQIWWHEKHVGGCVDFLREIENTWNYGDAEI